MSVALTAGVLYMAIGLIFGAIISVGAMFGGPGKSPTAEAFGIAGVAAVVVFPLLYGALGFVFAGLTALLYNFISRLVGGIRIEVEQ